MKALQPMAFPDLSQALAQIFIGRRTRKEWLAQSAQIKTTASNQNGHVATRFNLINSWNRSACPISRGKRFERRNKIDQMMRHAATLFHGNFCGRDLDVFIDLN